MVLSKHRDVLVFEIISNYGNHTHGSKVTGSHGEIGRGATQNFIDCAKGCLHGIEGNRTHNQNGTTHRNSFALADIRPSPFFTIRADEANMNVASRPPSGPYPPPRIVSLPAMPVVHKEDRSKPDRGKPKIKPRPTFHPTWIA